MTRPNVEWTVNSARRKDGTFEQHKHTPCKVCGAETTGHWHKSMCQKCTSKRAMDWQAANKEKASAAHRRWLNKGNNKLRMAGYTRTRNLKKYGITPDEYAAELIKQDHRCAICKTNKPGGPGKKLFVDHCHATKRFRGLLCHRCNFLLGLARDSTKILLAAFDYLHYRQGDTSV